MSTSRSGLTDEQVEQANAAMDVSWFWHSRPLILPAGWRSKLFGDAGICYIHDAQRKSVIVSTAILRDGKRWLHFSIAIKDRLPTWDEVVEAKELFLGSDVRALCIFPERSKWVNIHNFCLHLWCCMDGDGLPDFGELGTI